MELAVTGKFVLDNDRNPPPLKRLRGETGARFVRLGRHVDLRLGDHPSLLDGLLDARVVTSTGFTGLGDVDRGCAVICASNSCRQWALRARRPRVVAKIVGVMAGEARYVLLAQPRLAGSTRGRRETTASRSEAGLVPFVLVEPRAVECAMCPGENRGEVRMMKALTNSEEGV